MHVQITGTQKHFAKKSLESFDTEIVKKGRSFSSGEKNCHVKQKTCISRECKEKVHMNLAVFTDFLLTHRSTMLFIVVLILILRNYSGNSSKTSRHQTLKYTLFLIRNPPFCQSLDLTNFPAIEPEIFFIILFTFTEIKWVDFIC